MGSTNPIGQGSPCSPGVRIQYFNNGLPLQDFFVPPAANGKVFAQNEAERTRGAELHHDQEVISTVAKLVPRKESFRHQINVCSGTGMAIWPELYSRRRGS
jgi:hypothetical protein